MGCANSKEEETSPIVTLCRHRRDLIAAAAVRRHSLADAHAAYFAAVARVADALAAFVSDELTTAPPSPLLTLPPSKSKSDGSDVINGGSSISECSHVDFPPEDDSDSDSGSDPGSHLHFPSGSESEPPSFRNPSFHYMQSSASVPATIFVEPVTDRYDYQHYHYYNSPPPPMENPTVKDVPPPPVPEVSAWDFFNPFDSYVPRFSEYTAMSFRSGSGSTSSPDSRLIREKEGIPDLEEETEAKLEKDADVNIKKNAHPVREVVAENSPAEVEKGVSFREEVGSVVTEESSLGSSLSTKESASGCGPALHAHPSRGVVEAVEDIKEKFKLVAGCGGEVSAILEVGMVRYRSRNGLLRGRH